MAQKMTQKKATKNKAAGTALREADVIQATFDMIAVRGLGKTRLSMIAKDLGVPLPELYTAYPSVEAILCRFIDAVDARMMEDVGDAGTSDKRDLYFDMLMSRFDSLQEHRDGVKRWLAEMPKHPTLWASTLRRWEQSLSLMLDMAQDSPLFPLKKLGLAGIHVYGLRRWLEDDTVDMGKTMAAIDQALGKAGQFVARFMTKKRA